jgi:hypothetical protein
MTPDEWLVVGVIVLGLFAFEALPKLLNFIKRQRQKKSD